MAGARSAGRMPFMSASPLNRRSAALYGAELTQPGYQQRIAESPKFESITVAVQNIITIFGETLHGFSATGFQGRDEQIDNMLIAVVDERRYFAPIYVI